MASVQLLQTLLALLGLIKTICCTLPLLSGARQCFTSWVEWMQAFCWADSLFYSEFKWFDLKRSWFNCSTSVVKGFTLCAQSNFSACFLQMSLPYPPWADRGHPGGRWGDPQGEGAHPGEDQVCRWVTIQGRVERSSWLRAFFRRRFLSSAHECFCFFPTRWSAEAKWHIPSTKILNPLKQREGGKDSPNKLSRVNAWPTLISVWPSTWL